MSSAPIIRSTLSTDAGTSNFHLVHCSQVCSMVIFHTPDMCNSTIANPPLEIDWEGESYVVSLAPHDMTDNHISLEKGYLLSIDIMDFLMEYWNKEHIASAFHPFGSVIIIKQSCLSGADFSSLSICLNIKGHWISRRVWINAGREGIIFRLHLKGFINPNPTHLPPHFPPSSVTSPPSSDHLPSAQTNNDTLPDFQYPFPPCVRASDASM
jgi:hypothetical protein